MLDSQTVTETMARHNGNVSRTAKDLGVPRTTLRLALARGVGLPASAPAPKPISGKSPTVFVGATVTLTRGEVERYAHVEHVDDEEVRVAHRGALSSFSRKTRECVESEGGEMRGFTLAATL